MAGKADKKGSVLGIYPDREGVERATDVLIHAGFHARSISLLLPESLGSNSLTTEKTTKAPEGVAAGATSGAVVGGTLGLLVGIGALAIPGLGPVIAAGPILATLAGVGVGGTIGGVTGALVGLGIPEYEAKTYERRLRRGGILLSIHCDTSHEISRARDLMKGTGAHHIAAAVESPSGARNIDKKSARTHTLN
jgi:hypothetical protein